VPAGGLGGLENGDGDASRIRRVQPYRKKVENHEAAVARHFVWYNFVRAHQTLRMTPAMEAGLADKVCSVVDIVRLLDAVEKEAA